MVGSRWTVGRSKHSQAHGENTQSPYSNQFFRDHIVRPPEACGNRKQLLGPRSVNAAWHAPRFSDGELQVSIAKHQFAEISLRSRLLQCFFLFRCWLHRCSESHRQMGVRNAYPRFYRPRRRVTPSKTDGDEPVRSDGESPGVQLELNFNPNPDLDRRSEWKGWHD